MECNVPTDIVFSFRGPRGSGAAAPGRTPTAGASRFYEGRAARVFLETAPAAEEPPRAASSPRTRSRRCSPSATCASAPAAPRASPTPTRSCVSCGGVTGSSPTTARCPGFASASSVASAPSATPTREHAFCVLLEELRAGFSDYPRRPSELWQAVAVSGAKLARLGSFNFLLGDGRHLLRALRHASSRTSCAARPSASPSLSDDDVSVDFSSLTTPRDRVAVIATCPLTTDETWTHGTPGELWVFDGGQSAGDPAFAAAQEALSRGTPGRGGLAARGPPSHASSPQIPLSSPPWNASPRSPCTLPSSTAGSPG
jgi:hypothetical protein